MAKQSSAKKTPKRTTANTSTAKKAAKKSTAKRPTAKRPTAKQTPSKQPPKKPSSPPPFPFFGAGEARYFEWGSMYVCFETAPPRSARAAIRAEIPAPFRRNVEWSGPVLYCGGGDQFINLHIYNAYAALADETQDDDDAYDDEFDGRWGPWPNDAQAKAFEADITAWLLKTHAKQPIAFAARGEDAEAGGTELDEWHAWSLTRFRDVLLPRIAADIAAPDELTGWALRTALGLVLDSEHAREIPAKLKRWFAQRP